MGMSGFISIPSSVVTTFFIPLSVFLTSEVLIPRPSDGRCDSSESLPLSESSYALFLLTYSVGHK